MRNNGGRFYSKVESDPVAQLVTSHAVHNAFEFIICRLLARWLSHQLHCAHNPVMQATEVGPNQMRIAGEAEGL
jgi:hypothetical protein